MSKPIDRVYVCEAQTPEANLFTTDPSRAAEFMALSFLRDPTQRVFTEERPWIADRAPDSKRSVLALYSGQAPGRKWQIVAFFGSEGKWCAEDHNGRITYLDNSLVVGWRELPTAPPDVMQLGLPGTVWR